MNELNDKEWIDCEKIVCDEWNRTVNMDKMVEYG